MKNLLRLPRWLAGAFLLFMTPAFAYPAVAFNCSTVQYFRDHYSTDELRQMAKDHGYTKDDIAEAEKCLPKQAAPLEHGKRSPTLPPVHTLKARPKAAPVVVPAPVVVVAPVEAPAPVVVVESSAATTAAPKPAPVAKPGASSWLWDVLTYLGAILLVGSALGLLVNWGTKLVTAYRAARAVATIAKV